MGLTSYTHKLLCFGSYELFLI